MDYAKGSLFLNFSEVINLFVTVDMVDNAAQILHAVVSSFLPQHLMEESFHLLLFVFCAFLIIFNASVLRSCVFVVAEDGQTLGHDNDRVTFHCVSFAFGTCQVVEVICVVFIGHSGGSEGDHINFVEDLGLQDIDVGNNSKSSSQTDSSDVELFQFGLGFHFLEVSNDIFLDGVPHTLVGLLDFAIGADVGVDDLVGVEDILPDVEEGVGVPEGQGVEFGVGGQHALYILAFLLDVVGVEGSVRLLAHIALPVDKVELVVSAHNHRVGQQHLLGIGEGQCQSDKEGKKKEFHVELI